MPALETALLRLLTCPNPEQAIIGVVKDELRKIKPEQIRAYVTSGTDVPIATFPTIENGTVKYLLRSYWAGLSNYLRDANNIYAVLCENPANKKLLDTPGGRAWTTRECDILHCRLYILVWH